MAARIAMIVALLLCVPLPAHAGGPALVAGSGFNASVQGQPLVWAGGSVQYFTDQGDLSPILTNAQADALVASALGTWTSISGVALTATQGGHLAEDVNGSNVSCQPDGSCSLPVDIQPTALATPVGIVYDYDGMVTDAFLGVGAGSLADCFSNAVYGGPDNFSAAGNIVHALLVINGVCAASTSQLTDVQYRLLRTLGRVLGLGWSQANLNVITRKPAPVSDDYEGFPLMHFLDPYNCVPISLCLPAPLTPKMDDRSALRQLYPSASPQTGGIWGSVYFADASGHAAQPMQGVNVVARLIDSHGQPSRQYVATSVSGFAFVGNAGNPVNGYVNAIGRRYDFFGSTNPKVEGAYNLAGLEIPAGQVSAQYQLSVEGLDTTWSPGVGPYAPDPVAPSGTFVPVIVTVQQGSTVQGDIAMQQSALPGVGPGAGGTYANPAPLPLGGAWGTWLSAYGNTSWFQFAVQANRTASVTTIAVDASGQPSDAKAMPVIGLWPLSDVSGNPAPAATPVAFNTFMPGVTRLDAQFASSGVLRLGIADARGDGRPDYFYYGSVLYADSVMPARVSMAGGVAAIRGLGFHQGLQVSVGSAKGNLYSAAASQLQAGLPAGPIDGLASITVSDPASGGFSQMTGAFTYGADPTDLLLLVQGTAPATPVGSQSSNPISVRAVASDGLTPVNGATIVWNASGGAHLSACGGAPHCSVLSDASGLSSTWVTPAATGAVSLTAQLAPASYTPAQSQAATVVATSSSLDLAAIRPTQWIAQGASLTLALTAQALSNGVPQANVVVNFQLLKGTATLSSPTAMTNSSGFAAINASISNQNSMVKVSACVAPDNTPCQIFTLYATPPALWTLQTVSGAAQVVAAGQPFQPLILRVTDGAPTADPVLGAPVTFETTLERLATGSEPGGGDGPGGSTPAPVILGALTAQVPTDQDGLASFTPTAGSFSAPLDVMIAATVAGATGQYHLYLVGPMSGGPGAKPAAAPPPVAPLRPPFVARSSSTPAMPFPLFAVPVIVVGIWPGNESAPDLTNATGAQEPTPAESTPVTSSSAPPSSAKTSETQSAKPHAKGKQAHSRPQQKGDNKPGIPHAGEGDAARP